MKKTLKRKIDHESEENTRKIEFEEKPMKIELKAEVKNKNFLSVIESSGSKKDEIQHLDFEGENDEKDQKENVGKVRKSEATDAIRSVDAQCNSSRSDAICVPWAVVIRVAWVDSLRVACAATPVSLAAYKYESWLTAICVSSTFSILSAGPLCNLRVAGNLACGGQVRFVRKVRQSKYQSELYEGLKCMLHALIPTSGSVRNIISSYVGIRTLFLLGNIFHVPGFPISRYPDSVPNSASRRKTGN